MVHDDAPGPQAPPHRGDAGVVVRPAAVTDSPEVVRLAAAMYEAMGLDASGSTWRQAAAEQLRARLGDDAMAFVVDDPVAPGRLAACGAGSIARRLPGPLHPRASFGYIQWVSTDPAWRRRGLAGAITAALLDWFAQRGVEAVELHATAQGEPVYRALGFAPPPHPALRLRLDAPSAGRAGDTPG